MKRQEVDPPVKERGYPKKALRVKRARPSEKRDG